MTYTSDAQDVISNWTILHSTPYTSGSNNTTADGTTATDEIDNLRYGMITSIIFT